MKAANDSIHTTRRALFSRARGVALVASLLAPGSWLLASSASALPPGDGRAVAPTTDELKLIRVADEALNVWDLPAAVAAAEELEKKFPAGTDSLEMRALVRFHEGKYQEAVKLLDAASAKGRRSEQGWMVKLIRNTAKVTQHFKEKKGEHFVVRYEAGQDELLVEWTLATLEAQRTALERELGYVPPEIVPVEIYPTGDKFATVTTLTRAEIETTGTIALCKFNRMMITTPGALAYGYPWRDTLAHEYTHYVVARMSANEVPIWLHEGLAKYLEVRWRTPKGGDTSPTTETVLAEALAKSYFIPFEKMHPSIAKLPTAYDATLAFAEVESTISYSFDTFGASAVRNLILGLRDGKEMDAALTGAFGVAGLSGLEAKWKEHLVAHPPKLTPDLAILPTALKDPNADPDASGAAHKGLSDAAADHLRLGDMLAGETRPDAAIAEFRRAKEAEKKASARSSHGPIFDFKIANVYLLSNKLVEARKALGPVVEIYPSFSPGLRALGEVELRDGDAKKAKALFTETLSLAPFDLNAWALLSTACEKTGDKACADDARSKAEKLYAMRNGNH
jgi:tetratricopeptide (TPR) repeat protein